MDIARLYTKFVRLCSGNYNILFTGLILLFIFRPYDASILYLSIWKLLLTATLLAAIFNCKSSRQVKIAEVYLAIPTVFLCWLDLFWQHPLLLCLSTLSSVLFSFVCTLSIIYDVLSRAKITFEILRGVICAYFLVAVSFAYLFWFLEYLEPGTFLIQGIARDVFPYSMYLSDMMYFSFSTLLTIGFGDIIAVLDNGQTAVILEGLIGQFYMGILVSRFVSLYVISSQIKTHPVSCEEKKQKTNNNN